MATKPVFITVEQAAARYKRKVEDVQAAAAGLESVGLYERRDQPLYVTRDLEKALGAGNA